MKNTILFISLILFSILWSGCGSDPKPKIAPTNLVLEKTISIDGSGLVNFVATADNATKFYFSYGDLTSIETSVYGNASHTYLNSGTYNVMVQALSVDNLSIDVSTTVTIQVDEPAISDIGYSTLLEYPNMALVWQDEFDGTALNLIDWTHETGNNGWGNNELQNYQSENTIVENGYLTIKAKREGANSYTSSRMITKGKKEFKYGRVDIRAILPRGQGIWPALWMLGSNISTVSWPKCGEIDIMEIIGGDISGSGGGLGRDNKLYGTAHWDNANSYASYGGNTTLPSPKIFADEFHVFSIVWDAEKIVWYLDDVQYHIIDIKPAGLDEFQKEFFFIFNVAVGGNWPGNPDGSTLFPQRMIVDYIRVFQPI